MPFHTALKQVSFQVCFPHPRELHEGKDWSSYFSSTCPLPAQNRYLVNIWSILEIHCWHVAELTYTRRVDTEEMAVKPPLPHSNQMLGWKLETEEGISNHLRNTWLLGPSGVASVCPQMYLKDDSAGSFFMTCSRRVNKPLFPSHTKLLK